MLLALWPGLNFLALGIAHARGAHGVFGKRAEGTLPLWSWALFLPLHLFTMAVWHVGRLISHEPAWNEFDGQLVLGRRLLAKEFPGGFANVVDLTAEFPEPQAIRKSSGYRCLRFLDGAAPVTEALRSAIKSLAPGRTFIHCAQGHGRTGLFAAALLLSSGRAQTPADALAMLQRVRPGIRLSRQQRECLRLFAETAFDKAS